MRTDIKTLRVSILDADFRPHYYDNLKSIPGIDLQFSAPPIDAKNLTCDVGLLGDEFNPLIFPTLHELHQRNIPTLHLTDGIIEWRNIWTNPRSNTPFGRPLFQPVLATRIACLGLWQALLLESFGNPPFRCEITGSPRLDYLDSIIRTPDRTVLIASANTPGFTKTEIDQCAAGLQAVRLGMRRHPDCKPHWRLASELWSRLELDETVSGQKQASLASLLACASAVITTPSTLALEAMRTGIPTLVVDFTNSPCYLMSAWRATCPDTLAHELDSLLAPHSTEHARRLMHQTFLSKLQMEPGSATARVGNLIKLMARNPETGITPTGNLLPRRSAYPEGLHDFDMAKLYPMIPTLSSKSPGETQARLLHLNTCLQEIAELRQELSGYKRRRLVRFSDWARRTLPFASKMSRKPNPLP